MAQKKPSPGPGRPGWNKGIKLPPEPLTADEVRSLLAAASNRAPTGIRNRALIVVLWRAGLRISEALALMPRDVDLEAGTLHVRHGKGDRSRKVGIDQDAAAVLARWMDRRKALGVNGRRHVFCTLSGAPVHPNYVRSMLSRLAARAGIEKRVHPHGLRHTMAVELLQEGLDVGAISKQLGHASISTTARYLDHIAPERVIQAMRNRPGWAPPKKS